jgi:uncharacterized protein YbjT (DUF2867 family)
MTILVTGARGAIGGSVIGKLHAAGHPVRAASKSPDDRAVPAGVERVTLDLSRPDAAEAALRGVSRVFLYPQPAGIDDLLTAARGAGVEQVVLLSSAWVLAPGAGSAPISAPNLLVERALNASGITSTFLRPDAFTSNALAWSGFIRDAKPVPLAYPRAQVAAIHPADIADIAVEALTGITLTGRSVTLTGAESHTFRQHTEIIGEVLGRDVEVLEITRAEAEVQMARQMPALVVTNLLDVWSAAAGGPAAIGDTTQSLLGRPSRSFRQWVRENRAAFGGGQD